MKNFIFALFAMLSSLSVSAQFTIDTVYYEGFQNATIDVTIYDNDSCTFTGGGQQDDFWHTQGGGIIVRSDFNLTPPCQANDWVIINRPINITAFTWLKWDGETPPDNAFGVYLADTILPNQGNNFLTTPARVDSVTLGVTFSADSLDLSNFAGQRKYVAFRHFTNQAANGGYILLDNFLVINKIPVSVDEYTAITYSIYPNPANTAITVESEEVGDILIYNALGQLVQQQTKTDTKQHINISNLENGLYIVKLQTVKGSISHKIQKQ